jgi:peptidoglycan/LPS O-acetylase OafA/YrhL
VTARTRPSRAVSGHIPGLDGLRALAVLAVIGFHLWPRQVPGGFLGVDVFFVISGFLITTLLLRERDRTGRLDLRNFWLRRARRLLPALVVVVVTSVAVARLVDGDLLVGIQRQVAGALTFSSNWLEIGAGSDYFDDSAPALFVTFWSLAVEEQFYLLWPLLFLVLTFAARTPRRRVRVAAGLAVVSAALMAVLFEPGANPTRVYYGTDTHSFGLMIGAAVAFAFPGEVGVLGQRRWQRLRVWTGFVALAGLALLFVSVDSDSAATYRGGIVLASVLSAVAVSALPGAPTAFTQLNRIRPLAWVGERSYGIYLWHWPVILVVGALLPAVAPGDPPSFAAVILSVGATFVLSEVSYRWIEVPVRREGFRVAWARLGSTFAQIRRDRRALAGGGGLALASASVVLVVAGVAIGTAPEKSAVEIAVERGQRAIAAQGPPARVEGTPDSRGAEQRGAQPARASATAPEPAWPLALETPPGGLMSGFGDSVLSGAAPALYERFPGIQLDAVPIRQWGDAPAVVRQALAAGTVRPVVVLSFGTNAGLETGASRAGLREVLELLGPSRRVVLVNVVGVSEWVPSTNDTLDRVSASHPNTVVADWNARVSADPSLVHDDRTHPDFDGIVVYADVVAEALKELGPG